MADAVPERMIIKRAIDAGIPIFGSKWFIRLPDRNAPPIVTVAPPIIIIHPIKNSLISIPYRWCVWITELVQTLLVHVRTQQYPAKYLPIYLGSIHLLS